ncbi:competence protein CglD [Streptococcus pneumoniae]|nr:competence protein CglD [Streptococcus pneumoniae]
MIKAFTMLESLLVLGLVSILALGLSGSVQSTFAAVRNRFSLWSLKNSIGKPKNAV